ncbi:Protein bem46 [Leucoagaricus sp. SymC.cos]|nr:Protein bem46 [Leucoagaricus sp. SymC.cos]
MLLGFRRPITSGKVHLVLRNASTLPQFPPLSTVISIVLGLPLALWTYKCTIMVLFQRRIIYMGYVPLGARNQHLGDLPPSAFHSIQCREVSLQGSIASRLSGILVYRDDVAEEDIQVLLLYFQGTFALVNFWNAGNPIHRIPIFQHLCKSTPPQQHPRIGVLAVAPRSYWKSTPRRPTQSGIIQDYITTLRYALQEFPAAQIVVYGHSLGGAAAICTLAELQQTQARRPYIPGLDRIRGLVLENPFASIPSMVRALYPQKWLPYRYLAPLAFDKWDALTALQSHIGQNTTLGRVSRDMLVLLSEHDEIVPQEMGAELFRLATEGQSHSKSTMVWVHSALHENAWTKKTWIDELRKYLTRLT